MTALELGQTCSDVASLQAAYQAVIDKYKAKILDFDVEHTAIEDPVSIDRRSQALKALAAANPGLQINYTLPATPAGLTDLSVNVIKSAVKYGTPVAVVNLMAMDYGSPVPTGAMGPNAVAAAAACALSVEVAGLECARGNHAHDRRQRFSRRSLYAGRRAGRTQLRASQQQFDCAVVILVGGT